LAFVFGPAALAAGALLVAAGALAVGMAPWTLLRGSRPLLLMVLFVGLFRSVSLDAEVPAVSLNAEGLGESLIFGGGIILAFGAASLFFSVTTMTEIKHSLDRLRLKRLSLGISLMLSFLPRFFAVWDSAELAYRARCGKKGLPQLRTLLPLVMERMLVSAGETAAALESRGCLLQESEKFP
jgi:biotin transport system permease protein